MTWSLARRPGVPPVANRRQELSSPVQVARSAPRPWGFALKFAPMRLTLYRGVAAALALFTPLAALCAQGDFEELAALERTGARVTAAAVDLADGSILAQLNADTRLTPASLTKLTVSAATLDAWPADKVFRTQLLTTAPLNDGELAGDLVLQGAGDPSLDDQSLWSLAAQLKGAGVTSIRGHLVVNAAPFGVVACETEDRCKALERSDTAYNAPLASIGVDFGNWCVSVRPAQVGEPAAVRGCGVMSLPIPVEGTIRTVSAGGKQTFWVERATRPGGDVLKVSGNIPEDRGQELYRAMSKPTPCRTRPPCSRTDKPSISASTVALSGTATAPTCTGPSIRMPISLRISMNSKPTPCAGFDMAR